MAVLFKLAEPSAVRFLEENGFGHSSLKLSAIIGCAPGRIGFSFFLYPMSDTAYIGTICWGQTWTIQKLQKFDPRSPEQRAAQEAQGQ